MNRQVNRVRCIRHPGGVLVAIARLNHEVLAQLLVDTGAAITVVVPRTAGRLGLSLEEPNRTMTIGTACTARTSPIPVLELDHIQVGDAEVTDHKMGVVSFPYDLRIERCPGRQLPRPLLSNLRVRHSNAGLALVARLVLLHVGV